MKTRKWKKSLLTFVLIGALLGVQVMEMVAFAAETGTDALEPSVVCSNYSQLYSAIIQAQDGDVIGINDTIIVGTNNTNNVLGDTDKHVTIVRMNQLAVLYLSHSGTFTIQNITFDGNGIDSGNSMILVNNSCIMNDVTVQNCSSSLYYGAAVQVAGGTTTMNRCTFKNNIANEGGHIAVMNDSVLNMTDCTLTEGHAGQNGGAIFYNSSSMQYGEISSSVIHANEAGASGGGIYVASGSLIVNPSAKLYGNIASQGADMTVLITGSGRYTDNLETLTLLFADENIKVNGWEMTQDPDTATKYYKLNYEEIVQEQPGDSEESDDTGDDTTDTSDPTTPGEGDSTDEPSTDPDEDTTEPSDPGTGEDEGDDQEDTTQPDDSDQDSTEDPADPDAGDSDDAGQDSTDGGGNTDNSSNNGNTTNTTENSGNTTNTDNSSNDTTVDNSSNDVVTDNSDHSSTDNSQTDNSQTTTDNSDHSTTTNTSDSSSHDTNTTTTNNSSDNSSKTTTTDNSQRSEDNSSVVTTYNYYQNPENQSQVQSGQQMQPIVVNNYIQPSQEGQQVEEADDPSNNIKIDAEGVDVVFEVVDGVYSISIKAAQEEPQVVQTVQDAVVPTSNQAAEPAFNVNWYEVIKIGLLVAILVNIMWKPRQNSPA